jgi:hypothetical protein
MPKIPVIASIAAMKPNTPSDAAAMREPNKAVPLSSSLVHV